MAKFRTPALTPRKNPGFYRTGGLVVCGAGLDVLEKIKISYPISSRRHPKPQAFGGTAVGRSYLMHILTGISVKSFEMVNAEI